MRIDGKLYKRKKYECKGFRLYETLLSDFYTVLAR